MTALRRRRPLDIWPAFVDATASLLLVVVFALLLAITGHLVLSYALTDKDKALSELTNRVSKLAEVLSLEQEETARLEKLLSVRTANLEETKSNLADAQAQLAVTSSELDASNLKIDEQANKINEQLQLIASLQNDIAGLQALRDRIQQELETQLADNEDIRIKLEQENQLNIQNLAQIELLNQQMNELRQQLAALASALEAADKEIAEKQTKIDDLGQRLNVALANKAQLLQKYRSEFFGRLRDALSEYPNIRIEGDRFVLPSGLLFESGSDQLGKDGKEQVKQLANTLAEIANIIPDDIDWILRIDGHTDKRPISGPVFKSNWELSSARSISMVKELIKNGIAAERLAATGFAANYPADTDETAEAYAKNRRIELKLTSR